MRCSMKNISMVLVVSVLAIGSSSALTILDAILQVVPKTGTIILGDSPRTSSQDCQNLILYHAQEINGNFSRQGPTRDLVRDGISGQILSSSGLGACLFARILLQAPHHGGGDELS